MKFVIKDEIRGRMRVRVKQNASFKSLLIRVVFPAPRNPDIISTFVMLNNPPF